MSRSLLDIPDEILDALCARVNLLNAFAIKQSPAIVSHFIVAHGRVDICGEMIWLDFTGFAESPGRQFGSFDREKTPSEIELIFERPRIQLDRYRAGSGAFHIIPHVLMDFTEQGIGQRKITVRFHCGIELIYGHRVLAGVSERYGIDIQRNRDLLPLATGKEQQHQALQP